MASNENPQNMGMKPEYVASKNWQYRLNREKLLELRKIFEAFDDDCDGILDYEQFVQALRAAGVILSSKDIQELIKDFNPEPTEYDMAVYFVAMARLFRDRGEYEPKVRQFVGKLATSTIPGKAPTVPIMTLRNGMIGQGDEPLSADLTDEFLGRVRAIPDAVDSDGLVRCDDLAELVCEQISWPKGPSEKPAEK